MQTRLSPHFYAKFQLEKLQNGSDIRGIAIDGVFNEPVNLTPEIAHRLGQAFTTILPALSLWIWQNGEHHYLLRSSTDK